MTKNGLTALSGDNRALGLRRGKKPSCGQSIGQRTILSFHTILTFEIAAALFDPADVCAD